MQSEHFVEISDPLLILMTAGALPAGIALGIWEVRNWEIGDESLVWLRGAVAWSVIPYYAVYSVPILNMQFVEMTAHSTEWLLEFSGLGSYQVGEMMVAAFLPKKQGFSGAVVDRGWLLLLLARRRPGAMAQAARSNGGLYFCRGLPCLLYVFFVHKCFDPIHVIDPSE